jgi:hypothetical protein
MLARWRASWRLRRCLRAGKRASLAARARRCLQVRSKLARERNRRRCLRAGKRASLRMSAEEDACRWRARGRVGAEDYACQIDSKLACERSKRRCLRAGKRASLQVSAEEDACRWRASCRVSAQEYDCEMDSKMDSKLAWSAVGENACELESERACA